MLNVQLNFIDEFLHDPWHDIKEIEQVLQCAAIAAFEKADTRAFLKYCKSCNVENELEVVLVLTGDSHVKELNHEFRGQNKTTNVLSFPWDEEEVMSGFPLDICHLGDVILALETITLEAGQQNKPLKHHITHLVVHGVLHLCGYDHIEEDEAGKMEQLEIEILEKLQIPSPYRDL